MNCANPIVRLLASWYRDASPEERALYVERVKSCYHDHYGKEISSKQVVALVQPERKAS